jgi:hypothetical protein
LVATPGCSRSRPESERIERLEQVVAALFEMHPALIVDWNDRRLGKRLRGFDGVICIHGEMERSACLRRASE